MRCATLLTSLFVKRKTHPPPSSQDINKVAAPEDTPPLQQQRLMFVESSVKINFQPHSDRSNPTTHTEMFNRHSWNKCSLDSTPFWHLLQEADPLSLRYCRLLKVGKKLRETRQAVIFILEGRSKFHSFL
ncbi:hypothetical protein ERO13_A05G075900v2 [Gossypium hirsutum]|uniref:Uncharacterized protein n=1 Tax=Gossypium tomentosum TaxID=34277 RepID=A0A5D2QEW2_GOSTO|nr:hypothetical protein ERO13_A05G075900v2 [Gossypium hirsutum]TYI25940.1 hypothetical protein ES332_A05G081800v1 [Gossypium tomentosum]